MSAKEIRSFRDLEVWNAGMDLVAIAYRPNLHPRQLPSLSAIAHEPSPEPRQRQNLYTKLSIGNTNPP